VADFSNLDIWKVAGFLRNPIGPAPALEPDADIPSISMAEIKERRQAARSELLARGLTEGEVDVIGQDELKGNRVITSFLARGGPRYGRQAGDKSG
jgi:hypothetical protein